MNRIYIAGAHSRGRTMGYYLQYLDPSIEILAYLYDKDEENPSDVDGIPVIRIDETTVLDTDCPVYLGTRAVNHPHLTETLKRCGMKRIIPVDVKLDLDTRNRYLKKYYESIGREYLKLEELDVPAEYKTQNEKKVSVYVASSAFDKPLQSPYTLADYERIIQVGTALTEQRIQADYVDNTGDNISKKNVQFCELTGLYWIWKHATEDIVGLVHYRRHFTIPEDWQDRMEYHNIDVILPLPLYVAPSVEGNFKSRHIASDWDFMLEYLKANKTDDYEKASHFFKETALYSPCNMFIMKKEVLDELCSWLFPILFAVAENGGTKDDSYLNRYPGFISERLITYYFDKNRLNYKVVYADKNFLL